MAIDDLVTRSSVHYLRPFNLFQNGMIPCRKTLFLQKGSISADRGTFGRISVLAKIHNSKASPFGYLQKEEKSLSFDLYT